jgi:hypothetical protein
MKGRMKNDNHESWRYISVETWFHDVLKYFDDTGDQRKAHPRTRIIDKFGISKVIGCFVVQVWMARVLCETKKRNEGVERVLV